MLRTTAAALAAALTISAAPPLPPGCELAIAYTKDVYAPGEVAVLVVSGTPGTQFALLLDTDPGPTEVPGVGTLDVGLSKDLVVLHGFFVPPSGVVELTCDLPCPYPGAGTPLHTQAVGIDPFAPAICISNSDTLLVAESDCDEGCTPGFWKNHPGDWDGEGADLTSTVVHTASFNAFFGVSPAQSGLPDGTTLLDAVHLGGHGLEALARHATAAAANADASIAFPFTLAEVVAIYRDGAGADPGPLEVEEAKDLLESANEAGCPF